MSTIPLRALVDEATQRLQTVSESPAIDARRIVERATGMSAAELRLESDRPVTKREIAHFDRMLDRRSTGEPLQYVLGSWGFRHLDLFLDRRVLIPRPETETVVEVALRELDRVRTNVGERRLRVVDLGTGSGAIALSMASERNGLDVWATDVSADALDVARANLVGIGSHARHVQLVAGDWFAALPDALRGSLDVVVSNPPYVCDDDALPEIVRAWEPASALFAGPTGLSCYERIIPEAADWLCPTGVLVVEIGDTQAAAVRTLAAAAGFAHVDVHGDLTGRDRAVVMRR